MVILEDSEEESNEYCNEFITYINNTYEHKFIRRNDIKYINLGVMSEDLSRNIFICNGCDAIYHIWSVNEYDYDGYEFNNKYYVIYGSLSEYDVEFIKSFISCNEQIIKNLLE